MASRCFLIKPASGKCNMRCDYCFYVDEMKERQMPCYGMMSEKTAANLIEKAFSGLDRGNMTFMFQGGEPSVRGLSFFRYFVSLVRQKQKGTAINVNFAFQSNGYLIDDEWASFFAGEHFLVGLSLDGPEKMNDSLRHAPDGSGSFSHIMRAVSTLKAHRVEFNILSTVTKDVCLSPEEEYAFFKEEGLRHLQFIPCIDNIASDRGSHPWSISAEDYGVFLKKMFRLYFRDWAEGDYTSIRYFDNLVLMLLGNPPEECGMAGICGSYYTVESDGSVYPCDFYVLDEWRMGNINTDTLPELDAARSRLGFVEKSRVVDDECVECPFYRLCRGGCRRDRENFETGMIEKTYLCPAYKDFFSYAIPGLEVMARTIANNSR